MLNSKEFVRELQLRHESAWMNPNVGSAVSALLFVCFFVEKRSNSLLANVKNAYIV